MVTSTFPAPRVGAVTSLPYTSIQLPPTMANLPNGHGIELHPWDASGSVLGHMPLPANGTHNDHNSFAFEEVSSDRDHGLRSSPLPKMKFPKLDGSNPRWWADQCEIYFELYLVIPALKTRFTVLNFIAPASTWLQTMERKGCF